MPTLEELREIRIKKLESIEAAGRDPYPAKVKRDFEIKKTLYNFFIWRLIGKKVRLAGRIRAIREHGKAAFFDLEDESGKIQCFLSRKNLKNGDKYGDFFSGFDIGDFIEVEGSLFKTKKKEKTVAVSGFEMAAKTLRPLPEKWHGLKDVEERYRKRYLDLIMNPAAKEKFLKRSAIVSEVRNFLNKNGFREFETPMLQPIPGGASARPFKTHLNALDIDLYLRVAPELYLKRLLVGGFEKVYEIGRCFRNEGIDAHHNPEFTMLEVYAAYRDSAYLKNFTAEFLRRLVGQSNDGNLVLNYENHSIDFSQPFKEKNYGDLINEYGDLDIAKHHLIQPTFVSGFPSEILPLSKDLKNDKSRADAFQIFAGGFELVKAFTEQNNPIEQRKRFEEQEKMREKGEEEAHRLDNDFLEALEYGMPPCAGFGLGIDRLAALLTDSHTLREIILFPTMKSKIEHQDLQNKANISQ